MSADKPNPPAREEEVAQIVRKVERAKRMRGKPRQSAVFGLGMFGLVGWAVAIPTVMGTLLGIWIDRRVASGMSWTLALLLAGVALGCLNAWYWVQREGHDE